MTFGVVIVTYNRLDLLKECITCINNQTKTFAYVLVVDNASTDGTAEYLDKLVIHSDMINVIHSSSNIGGAGGFALGIKSAYKQVDYLLIIDDDAMLSPDYLESIQANMVDGILAYSGSVTTNGIIDTTHRRIVKNKVLMIKEDVAVEAYKKAFFDYNLATFCGLLVSTDIIKKIGFPREDFFIWYDDTEYSLRINEYTRIRNVNSAVINHKTKLYVDSDLTWKSYYGYRNASYVGFEYARNKLLYKLFRYSFFIVRMIEYRLIDMMKLDRQDYYHFCADLYWDVLHDVKKGVTGKNNKYLP